MENRFFHLVNGYIQHIINGFSYRDQNTWVFGEWFGDKCCDNSFYLANYIAREHPNINIFWISKAGVDTSGLHKTISVVEMDSEQSIKVLKSSSVAIMNQGFIDFSSKGTDYFRNCITLNLWHGLMWKKINMDIRKQGTFARIFHKLSSRVDSANYYLVSSKEVGKHIHTAFLKNEKSFVFAGYPRNTVFYNRQLIDIYRSKLYSILNLPVNSKIITYMPTFRDNIDYVFSFMELIHDNELNALLKQYNAFIVEKSHFISAERFGNKSVGDNNTNIRVINDIGATELLAATDILITDYSSCFFDFLILDRPIIHYIYDYDYYVNSDRGVYYTKEEIACGIIPQTKSELLKAIEEYLVNPNLDHDLRLKQRNLFWEYDSEDSCERIYHSIRIIQGLEGDSK